MRDLDPRITSIVYLVAIIVLSVSPLIDVETDLVKKFFSICTVIFGILAITAYCLDMKKNPDRYKKEK